MHRIRVLKIYAACSQGTAIRFIDKVLRQVPFRVLVVQTDRAEFQTLDRQTPYERLASREDESGTSPAS
jgi:hypothetical protein